MRKNFSFYIARIVLVVVIAAFVLHFVYDRVFQHVDNPRDKIQHLMRLHDQTFDVVFVGNSRVESGIDPALIESKTGLRVLNLGLQSARMADANLCAELLLAHGNQVKQLWVQVDFSYNFVGASPSVLALSAPYLSQSETVQAYAQQFDPYYPYTRDVPFFKYAVYHYDRGFRQLIKNAIYRSPRAHANGFFARTGEFVDYRTQLPEQLDHWSPDLIALQEICQKKGIQLRLFTAPYAQPTQQQLFNRLVKQRFPDLLDYSSIFSENSRYFVDNVHLNKQGAQAFTLELINDL